MEGKVYTQEEVEEGKSAAILAYIPFVCLVPYLKWKDNRFAYDHAKQGLALFIIELAAVILLIPGLASLIFKMALIVAVILAIFGLIFVLQDKQWKIPFIGEWIDTKIEKKSEESLSGE